MYGRVYRRVRIPGLMKGIESILNNLVDLHAINGEVAHKKFTKCQHSVR